MYKIDASARQKLCDIFFKASSNTFNITNFLKEIPTDIKSDMSNEIIADIVQNYSILNYISPLEFRNLDFGFNFFIQK
jgi:hypothetical protein